MATVAAAAAAAPESAALAVCTHHRVQIPRLPGALTDEQWLAQLTAAESAALAEFKRRIQDTRPEALLLGDRILMRLLFTRKLDVERALVLLANHLQWRRKYDIDSVTPADVEHVLRSGMNPIALGPSQRTVDGAGITYLFFRLAPQKSDKVKPTIRDMIRASWILGELMSLDNIDNDRVGFVIVEDFAGARLLSTHMWSSDEMREMMSCTQDSMPGRIRGIWVINAPWFVRLLMAMVRPFMKAKLQNKCQVLSMAELPARIPRSTLIPELGGTGAPINWSGLVDAICSPTAESSLPAHASVVAAV